jgi:hypothetical protein
MGWAGQYLGVPETCSARLNRQFCPAKLVEIFDLRPDLASHISLARSAGSKESCEDTQELI